MTIFVPHIILSKSARHLNDTPVVSGIQIVNIMLGPITANIVFFSADCACTGKRMQMKDGALFDTLWMRDKHIQRRGGGTGGGWGGGWGGDEGGRGR